MSEQDPMLPKDSRVAQRIFVGTNGTYSIFNPKSQRDGPMSAQAIGLGTQPHHEV